VSITRRNKTGGFDMKKLVKEIVKNILPHGVTVMLHDRQVRREMFCDAKYKIIRNSSGNTGVGAV
jgi:hypothetical protein